MADKLTQLDKAVNFRWNSPSQRIVVKIEIICTNSPNKPLESRGGYEWTPKSLSERVVASNHEYTLTKRWHQSNLGWNGSSQGIVIKS
jgi:hypothetical protein